MRYAVVIEKAEANLSAYVPDLPGCVATGATVEEVEREIREAIAFHLEGMREDGLPLPVPTSKVEYIELAAKFVERSQKTQRPSHTSMSIVIHYCGG
jgi:predicted RNase H-like HicB family nuclease